MRIYSLAVLALIVVVVIVAAVGDRWLVVHLSQELGISTQASRSYDFWSGVAPNIRDLVELPILASIWWYHHRCHAERCNRLGHPMPKGYRLCKAHAGMPVADLGLHAIHSDHQ